MVAPLEQKILTLLDDIGTVKVVATVGEDGTPHAVVSPFLQWDEDGRLIHLELLETSPTNRNLLRSLWFDRNVAVNLSGKDGRNFLIKGKPVKALISGPIFSRYYEQVRQKLGDADLAAVWFIEPGQVVNETYAERKIEEETEYPFSIHLDRLLVTNSITHRKGE